MTVFLNAKDAYRIAEDSRTKNELVKNESLSLKFDWVWPKIFGAAERGDLLVELCVDLSQEDLKSLISMLSFYGYKVTPLKSLVGDNPSAIFMDVRWS